MKDRSLRRHRDFKAKTKSKKNYNECIGDLSPSEREHLGDNIEKLRKACVSTHQDASGVKGAKKPLREMKHDITMREQLNQT